MIGVELEWPDVDPEAELLQGWGWSKTDYTIVNSDGTANDPLRKLPVLGGELNSRPYNTPTALARDAETLWRVLRPGHNYRSNLHIHVSGDWDLAGLKRIASYTRQHLPELLPEVDPLEPLLEGGETPEAVKRYRHSQRSRHYFTSEERHAQRLQASTLEEFLAAECPMSAKGKVQWHLASREAVNFRSLRKHGTIEFRHFAGPRDAIELWGAATWAQAWVDAALADEEPPTPELLPRQEVFVARLEDGWKWFNLKDNKRHVVKQRLAERRGSP